MVAHGRGRGRAQVVGIGDDRLHQHGRLYGRIQPASGQKYALPLGTWFHNLVLVTSGWCLCPHFDRSCEELAN